MQTHGKGAKVRNLPGGNGAVSEVMEYIVKLLDSPTTFLRKSEMKILRGYRGGGGPPRPQKSVAKLLEVRMEFIINCAHAR